MRNQTLRHLASQLRRGTLLAATSFALATALTGCDGAGSTEPTVSPSMDPGRIPDHKRPVLVRSASEAATAAGSSIQPILKKKVQQ
jgi:hypothetical protein